MPVRKWIVVGHYDGKNVRHVVHADSREKAKATARRRHARPERLTITAVYDQGAGSF